MRSSAAILAYFACASGAVAYYVHNAPVGPDNNSFRGLHLAERISDRDWHLLLGELATLWESLLRSEVGLFLALNFFFSLHAVAALVTTGVFLGRLSTREAQRLSQRLARYVVFKVVFVGAVLSPDVMEVTVWLAWAAVAGYLRVFAGAAKDRLDVLVVSPAATTMQHARAVALLVMVLAHDALAFAQVLQLLSHLSTTKVLLCGFDAVIIAVECAKTLTRYAVHMSDRARHMFGPSPLSDAAAAADPLDAAVGGGGAAAGGTWEGWEAKGSFLYHIELVADVFVHALTLVHYLHVWALHGLSFHLIDAILLLDIRAVAISMLRRIRGYLTYRAATRCLNSAFMDVRPGSAPGNAAAAAGGVPCGECAAGDAFECTICMESITRVGKQLPCGHVFHLSCLRAWLQQSGSDNFTCPNCRKPILMPAARRGRMGGLVGLVERMHERLLLTLEPMVLRLAHRVAHWLGQAERPAGPREGMGESADPPRRMQAGVASDSFSGGYESNSDDDDEEDPYLYEEDAFVSSGDAEVEDEYGDVVAGWDDENGLAYDQGGAGPSCAPWCQPLPRHGHAAAAGAGAMGNHGNHSGGGIRPPPSSRDARRHGTSAQRAANAVSSGDGADAYGDGAGAPPGVTGGPSTYGQQPRALRPRRLVGSPTGAPELQTWSGQAVPKAAAALARGVSALGQTLRSSVTASGLPAAAVAGHDDEVNQPEVCSRRRSGRTPRSTEGTSHRTRGAAQGGAVAVVVGDAGGDAGPSSPRQGRASAAQGGLRPRRGGGGAQGGDGSGAQGGVDAPDAGAVTRSRRSGRQR